MSTPTIPALRLSDGPHGLLAPVADADTRIDAVCFPAGCCAASSFDPMLLRRLGGILGRECRAAGVNTLLGPNLNIKRSPLCGRGFEGYSEDPCLTGALAAAFIEGVQNEGIGAAPGLFAAPSQLAPCAFADHRIDERPLREIYLPPFETAVKTAYPKALVCADHPVNGIPASDEHSPLREILRSEWDFDGLLLSERDAAPAPVQTPAPAFDRIADHHLAADLAAECAVLLQNKGALPLRQGQKVAYIGAFAQTPRYQGGGSRQVNTGRAVSVLHAAEVNNRQISYAPGFPADRDQRDEEEFLHAIATASAADAAVIFAGLPESADSADCDRRHMRLPDCQNNLIARIAAVQKNTVVVLHTGGPVECPWADDVNAVLCLYLAGEGVGTAADRLLWGDASPAGRLAESWPLRLEDTPAYLDYPGDGVTADYREGAFVGYRWYDARKMPVRWPFGHGMSYSGFVYRAAALSADALNADDENASLTVTVEVANSGAVRAAEVVQLYVADQTGCPTPGGRVVQSLRGFQKLWLGPGETATAAFTLTARDFGWYSVAHHAWHAHPGRYELRLGHSSRDIRATLPLTLHTKA